MLDANEMNKVVMRENRARLAEEFEAEYPEIVEGLGSIILESAKSGDDCVSFLLEGKMREIKNLIEKYLICKGYRVKFEISEWGGQSLSSKKPSDPHIPPEFNIIVIRF
jgi:hypothetical protein